MAKKLNANPDNIINEIINRYNNDFYDIFLKLFEYEKQLKEQRHKYLFSVDDCKKILEGYDLHVPYTAKKLEIEIRSECLLLLYNWQKCKVVYNLNTSKNIEVPNEYINPQLFNEFPYPAIYINYHFENTDCYGVFVTRYRYNEGVHWQKRLLLGYVLYDVDKSLWIIEPIFFEIKNNISVIDSIKNTMKNNIVFNEEGNNFIKHYSQLSYFVIKCLNTIIEYYNLSPNTKQAHTYKKFARKNNEYEVVIEINSHINTNKSRIVYAKGSDAHIKSSPKSPHPRRSHTRTISIKDEFGNIIDYRTIEISASYIHKDEVKPINIKTVET